MINPKFHAEVEKGTLIFSISEKSRYESYLGTLKGEVEVIVKRRHEIDLRSNQQNRYLFGVIYKIISEELGYTIEEIHELCRKRFLCKVIMVNENEVVIPRSTTELNTIEMEEYLTEIRTFAAVNLGLFIPEPNEVDCA